MFELKYHSEIDRGRNTVYWKARSVSVIRNAEFIKRRICVHSISLCLGFRARSSTDMTIDPAQLAGDTGIHPGGVRLSTAVAPGDHTCHNIVITTQSYPESADL